MTLKAESKPCWTIACDRCGDGDNVEYGGSYHYPSEEEARSTARDHDWILTEDGRALCLECFERTRSEIACPHGAGCNGGGCGRCPSDADVFARLGAGS